FVLRRLFPLLLQTCERYINVRKQQANGNSDQESSSPLLLQKIFGNDLHPTMYNRKAELNYLNKLFLDLMPIITPRYIYECKGARHFLRELIVCQILIDGVDIFCDPKLINRLFYLYFETKRRAALTLMNDYNTHTDQLPNSDEQQKEKTTSTVFVELLSHFCSMNGPIHKNQLSLELTDVLYEKELMNQFSRVLDRSSSVGLLSIYLTLTDVLNDIPLASDITIRKNIIDRLKKISEKYLNPENSNLYIFITTMNSSDTDQQQNGNEKLINDIRELLNNDTSNSTNTSTFDIPYAFTVLSRFHCKIYELLEEKYQQCFLKSDEHFLYICGKRMDSPDYAISDYNQK
ncbi:unnamed protein product, partial [Didymodactylos carnosus]